MSTLRLDDQLCFALHAAARAVTGAYRPALKELGLTYTQYITLMVLWESDGIGVTELGGRLRLDSGTLTPLLKRLEAQGLVRRERDAQDERCLRIWLTGQGRGLEEAASEVHEALACRLEGTPEELGALRAQLLELVRALDGGA